MDLVDSVLYNLIINIYDLSCLLFWITVRLLSVLVFTGRWCYEILEFMYCSTSDVVYHLSHCNNGVASCALDMGQIVSSHTWTLYNKMRTYTSLWELMSACVWTWIIVRSPELRKPVLSSLAFFIDGSFVILRKLINYRRNEPASKRSTNWTIFTVLTLLLPIPYRVLKWVVRLLLGRRKMTGDNKKNFVDSSLSCVVCQTRSKCVLLLPCKHVCLCLDCSNQLVQPQCPLCRKTIKNTMKLYI